MQREKWVDSLRGAAILLVIVGHSGCPDTILNYIYSFHMPLFFIISGYLFNEAKWNEKGTWCYIKSRLTAYVKPYFILCLVNYLLCLIWEILKNGLSSNTVVLMKTWVFGVLYAYPDVEHMPNCTPLWFLVALTFASIFVFFILKVRLIQIQIMIVILTAVVDAILAKICPVQLPWCLGAAFIGCCCMYIGHAIRQYSLTVSNPVLIVLFIVGSISACVNGRVGVGANNLGNNPVLFWISALCLSFVCMFSMRKAGDHFALLQYYGRNTILFMGFNYFFNTATAKVWYHMPILKQYYYHWILMSIACVICISIVIFAWDKIKKRIPILSVTGF